MQDSKIITLEGIKKQYQLGSTVVHALKGVSFSISKGEFTAIAGPSGSGKSTILNLIGCIDSPSDGRVEINGKDISQVSDKELTRFRRRLISFIFQSFNLIPVLNVYENIELPLLLDPETRKNIDPKFIYSIIEKVGLSDRIKNKPSELSGGQRQRVAIARALVTKPIVVLADEPTANLDSETGQSIIELMKGLNKNEGTTFIFSTHDSHIMTEARRVVLLKDGLVVSDVTKGA